MSEIGRPSKYDEKVAVKAAAYVKHCRKFGTIPFIEELAMELDINDDTIVSWSKLHEEFSATIKKLKMLQRLHLKRGALEKKLHPSMAIFLLKSNHDEGQIEDPKSMTIQFISAIPKTIGELMQTDRDRQTGARNE